MKVGLRPRPRSAALAAAIGAVTVLAGTAAVTGSTAASATPASAAAASGRGAHSHIEVRHAIDRRVCPLPTRPGIASCMAFQRVDVPAGTPGSYTYKLDPTATVSTRAVSGVGADVLAAGAAVHGPGGGYTPAALAAAYGYNPDAGRGVTVAVVDWFDNPDVRNDLNRFDRQYGLPAETARSFRVVNQNGAAAPLPRPDRQSSVEIDLDVEAVRAVCHGCRIVLVEANINTAHALAVAENTAVHLGADVVSNSYGIPESKSRRVPAAVVRAYRHPGVPIVASAGDDGYRYWDTVNQNSTLPPAERSAVPGVASFPASSPDVVSVGGTTLNLTKTGARKSETVWNSYGPSDSGWRVNHELYGASGGGCSAFFAAPAWQRALPGYRSAGCDNTRLSVDVAALGDPNTGLSVYDSWAFARWGGWQSVGGTSLAAPVIAGMWGLVRGAHGTTRPAQLLYQNEKVRPASVNDVTAGGNGWCGGDTPAKCALTSMRVHGTPNPNAYYHARVDCSFPLRGTVVPTTASTECTAASGYDGASGVGTPNGLTAFRSPTPTVTVTEAGPVSLKQPVTLRAQVTDPVRGATITSRTWSFGDGSKPATGYQVQHTFTRAGTYRVVVTVTDSAGQRATGALPITVGRPLHLVVRHSAEVWAGEPVTLRAGASSTPNTGARITSFTWRFADRSPAAGGATVTHTWRRAGSYAVRLVATDSSGVTTTRTVTIRVR